jgi:Cof subfamily protein (haloacid dehalogenase superfamily)
MSTKTRYRLIVLDIDVTLIDGRRTVSPRMVSAIAAARDAGAVVSLATGRMLRSAVKYAELSGATGPVICYQGALTTVPGGGKVLRKVEIGASEVRDALLVLRAAEVHINVYVDDDIYVEGNCDWATGYSERMEVSLRNVDSLDLLADRGPLAILGVQEPDASGLVAEVRGVLDGRARVTHSLRHFCEIGGREGGKKAALESLAGHLGVDRASVIAFGDGQGDEEMLAWASLGVAVGDAHPDVLSAADLTVPGPETDGPAEFIEHLLRKGCIGA